MGDRDTRKQQNNHDWLQIGGAYPTNAVAYSGVTGDWVRFDNVDIPFNGGFTRYNKPDPFGSGGYISTGATADPIGDFSDIEMQVFRRQGFVSRILYSPNTPFTAYSLEHVCTTPDDPHAWTGVITVRPEIRLSSGTFMARANLDGNDEINDTFSGSVLRPSYEAYSISLGQRASSLITRGTFGVAYGGNVQDASCGEPNNGDKWVYVGHLGDGTTNAPTLVYSLRRDVGGDVSYTEASIALTGATNTEVGKAVVAYGNTLVVVTDAAYYVATIGADGIPGARTRVTTGLSVPTNAPNDAYLGEYGLIIVGQAGYVYRSTNLSSGVTVVNGGNATTANLSRVRGYGSLMVAGGASGSLIYSQDGGQTWAAMVSPGVAAITAVEVTENSVVYVGAGGTKYATRNLGQTWDTVAFDGSGSGVIDDIRYATPEMGFIAHSVGGVGRVFSTWSGGAPTLSGVNGWAIHSNTKHRRLINLPSTIVVASRLAVPRTSNPTVAVNNLAISGTITGTTGMLFVGRSAMI